MILLLAFVLAISYPIVSASSRSTCYTHTPGVGTHKYHNQRKTWNEAKNICLNEGEMNVFSSAEEKLFLSYMNVTGDVRADQIWIGVHELFERDQSVTVKDERFESIGYAHWWPGQPNHGCDDEHCLTITPIGLNDYGCYEELPFVCEF